MGLRPVPLSIRVVNVVDLAIGSSVPAYQNFDELFTTDKPVIFASMAIPRPFAS
jgi:phosphoketolase